MQRCFSSGLKLYLGALALAALAVPTPASAADAVQSVALPFEHDADVRVIEGYNGGTHQDASFYGLDLVLASGETSGAPVLSPLDGSVAWAFEPGAGNGCIEVLETDRRFGVMMCHVLLDRPFAHGEKVARGEVLGSVGEAGRLGNNGTPHVHLELHQGGHSEGGVPFSAVDGLGLTLEGDDLPFTGASNDHADEALVSSNVESAAPAVAGPASAAAPALPVKPNPTPAPARTNVQNTRRGVAPGRA